MINAVYGAGRDMGVMASGRSAQAFHLLGPGKWPERYERGTYKAHLALGR